MKNLLFILLTFLVVSCNKQAKIDIKGSYVYAGLGYSEITTYCTNSTFTKYEHIPNDNMPDYTKGMLAYKGTYQIVNDTIIHTVEESAHSSNVGRIIKLDLGYIQRNLTKIQDCSCNCN
jgi:hypothetical protein